MIDKIAQRIEYFIVNQSISPKDFADRLGVQRSAISHILSGRNKPSLDFILKMLQAYPEIDQKWLLHGKEQIRNDHSETKSTIDNDIVKQKDQPNLDLFADLNTDVNDSFSINVNSSSIKSEYDSLAIDNENNMGIYKSKIIQRVILLYSDGSFDSYEPKNSGEIKKE